MRCGKEMVVAAGGTTTTVNENELHKPDKYRSLLRLDKSTTPASAKDCLDGVPFY